jgi:hypothetical protein
MTLDMAVELAAEQHLLSIVPISVVEAYFLVVLVAVDKIFKRSARDPELDHSLSTTIPWLHFFILDQNLQLSHRVMAKNLNLPTTVGAFCFSICGQYVAPYGDMGTIVIDILQRTLRHAIVSIRQDRSANYPQPTLEYSGDK